MPHRKRIRPTAVLLVDDDPDGRTLLRDALEQTHLTGEVYDVATGEEALDYLSGRGCFAGAPRPGLIYLDIEMPGIGGQATLERIKRDPDLRDIPVVVLTGLNDDSQMRLAAASGANSYIVKPSDPMALVRAVQTTTHYWMQLHRSPALIAERQKV